MHLYLFGFSLFFLQGLYFFIANRSSSNTNSYIDYFLAGKKILFWPLTMTFFATQVGGGILLGSADEAYRFGWLALLYPLGTALGVIAFGCAIGRRVSRFKVATMAEILQIAYGSIRLRKIASLFSLAALFMILIAQMVASSKFFVTLGVDSPPLFVAFWGFVIIYTIQGGLRAVVSTDRIQAVLFMCIFFACSLFVIYGNFFSFSLSAGRLEEGAPVFSKIGSICLMPWLFMLIAQDMSQRSIAARPSKSLPGASILAGIGIFFIGLFSVAFGVLAKQWDWEIDPKRSVLMEVIQAATNPWVSAIVGCIVLTAITTTAISLINAMGSNLSSDFSFSFLRKKEHIPILQGMTCTLSLAAILFVPFFDSILNLLVQGYGFFVSCFLVSLLAAIFLKKGNVISAWLSLSFGLAGFVFVSLFSFPSWEGMMGPLLSLVGYLLGEAIVRLGWRYTIYK